MSFEKSKCYLFPYCPEHFVSERECLSSFNRSMTKTKSWFLLHTKGIKVGINSKSIEFMFLNAFIHVQHIVYHPVFTVSCYFPVQIHLSPASLPFSKAESKLCDKQRLQVTRQRVWGREPEAAPDALLGKQPNLVPCPATPEYPRPPSTKKQWWKEFPCWEELTFPLFTSILNRKQMQLKTVP